MYILNHLIKYNIYITIIYYLKQRYICRAYISINSKIYNILQRHRQQRLAFALKHREWTVEDWKRVIWSDETKSTGLGQMGGSGSGNRRGMG